jgi:uncharacterized membrane-anchored protein YitT (DUF2179 family)
VAHTYRASTKMIGTTVSLLGGGGLVLLIRMSADDEVPGSWLVWFAVGWVVFAGLLMTLVLRPSTTVDGDGVLVRTVTKSRRYAWTEITDVRFEQVNLGVHGACLYDTQLRRIPLPHLTSWGDNWEMADGETRRLRAFWETHRGPAWQPRTVEVDQKAVAVQRRDKRLLLTGVIGGAVFGIGLAILMAVLG